MLGPFASCFGQTRRHSTPPSRAGHSLPYKIQDAAPVSRRGLSSVPYNYSHSHPPLPSSISSISSISSRLSLLPRPTQRVTYLESTRKGHDSILHLQLVRLGLGLQSALYLPQPDTPARLVTRGRNSAAVAVQCSALQLTPTAFLQLLASSHASLPLRAATPGLATSH